MVAVAVPASAAAAAVPAATEAAEPRAAIPCEMYLTDLKNQDVKSTWTFHVDAHGRPERATAKKLTVGDSPRDQKCETKVGNWGGSGFDGGHLIAATLKGVSKRVNLVPMERSINRGIYKSFETGAKNCIKAGKNETAYKSVVQYPNDTSVVPNKFTVSMVPKARGGSRGPEIRLEIPNAELTPKKKKELKNTLNEGLAKNGCTTVS
ncbi:hypothetical protein ADK47_16420 [Streptomyces rimosus subsp. rimosus]|uniref:DNA/RNA non-specific endonuclease n=1 Tax=Streptomyces rimosus TaxID=1927 RepID=UPI0004BEF831|nr:DNA/RNA non-specific endonuclease [Streptomyces rimosus]KOG73071.1 hypothetical protein ADK78_17585 [Kitasatospora aureofaciens]KOT38620.1 hypothetical protein ADK42_16865 [Streptomyces rimosus subsp. rimosus]KOT38721.1 hypothetical protein ADK84_16110 [Streptomyces sp. NRRL WC-3701]KEF04840.1 hypothetical protein DF17_21585 [Streptomyces rimosus]KOT60898.1 hypothetical protein ADK45_19250 [Streptomyces rimosus subsp. rimosus]